MDRMKRRVLFYAQMEDNLLHTCRDDRYFLILFWVLMDYSGDIERHSDSMSQMW